MTFTIAEPCVGVKSGECIDVCPVDCIHPTQSEAEFETVDMIYINPAECIDCGACESVCPVTAIFPADSVPDQWKEYTQKNEDYFNK